MSLKPAVRHNGRIYAGQADDSHQTIKESHGIDNENDADHGFIDPSAPKRFLTRKNAIHWLKRTEPKVYHKIARKLPPEGLHSHIYAAAKGIVQKLSKEDKREAEEPQAGKVDLSKLKCVVIDYGYFMNLARRLAEPGGFGEVIYTPPWHSYNPTPDRESVGMGIDGVTHDEGWEQHLLDADLIVFPDVGDWKLQKLFRDLKASNVIKARIFGMGDAENLELKRKFFKKKLDDLELFQPEWGAVYGIDALRELCQKQEKLWIKIDSKHRGIKETWYHDTYKSSVTTIDNIATSLGCLRDTFMFIWEKPFGNVEGGSDPWVSGGQFLPKAWRGFEGKNEWYICKAERMDNMPKPAQIVHDAIRPYYEEVGASGKCSDEIRTDEKGKAYWLDATMRFGDPPFGIELRGWKNLPQMIWACAGGEVVEPEEVAPYACLIVLKSAMAANEPCPVDFEDDKDEKHISLRRLHVAEDGQRYCVPLDHDDIIGTACGFGKTWQEAAEQALFYANRVKCRELEFKENVITAIEETLSKAKANGWGDF